MNGPHVLVTHPGRQHSHQAALALAKAGLLAGYWAGAPALARHRRGIPRAVWDRFVRYAPLALPAERVRWYPWAPVVRRLADASLPAGPRFHADYAACRLFDRWAARRLSAAGATAVIACEISALATFQRGRQQGLVTLLDAPSFHHTAQDRLHGFVEPAALHRRITAVKDAEIALADGVLTVSELARDTYLEAGVDAAKVHAVPLGADLELFRGRGEPGTRQGPLRFVFAGAMIRRKGFDLLLAAFAAVERAAPGCELLLIGPRGDAAGELARYPGAAVRELGSLPQAELARQLRAADCLVLPSRNDSYGMVVAEALAAGVPAVVSTMVGAKDLVRDGETGWVVPHEDLAALTARLLACASDPPGVRALSAACRRAAETATWEDYQRRFAALVSRLAGAA